MIAWVICDWQGRLLWFRFSDLQSMFEFSVLGSKYGLKQRVMRGLVSNANYINFVSRIFPRMTLYCKLVPVQYREYEYDLVKKRKLLWVSSNVVLHGVPTYWKEIFLLKFRGDLNLNMLACSRFFWLETVNCARVLLGFEFASLNWDSNHSRSIGFFE